jgi:hypothetical protein
MGDRFGTGERAAQARPDEQRLTVQDGLAQPLPHALKRWVGGRPDPISIQYDVESFLVQQ